MAHRSPSTLDRSFHLPRSHHSNTQRSDTMASLSACDNTLDPDSHLMRSPFGSPINSQDHINNSHPHLYSSVLSPGGPSWSYHQQQHPYNQFPQFHSRQNSNSLPVTARNIMSPLQSDLHQSPGIKSSVMFDNVKKHYRHERQHSSNDPLYQQNHAQTTIATMHSRSDSCDARNGYGFPPSQPQPQHSSPRGHIAGMAMVSMPSSSDDPSHSSHSKHTQEKQLSSAPGGQKATSTLKRRITKEKLSKNDREEVRGPNRRVFPLHHLPCLCFFKRIPKDFSILLFSLFIFISLTVFVSPVTVWTCFLIARTSANDRDVFFFVLFYGFGNQTIQRAYPSKAIWKEGGRKRS